MARIPLVTRDQIAENERTAYDAFMVSRANRPNIGPYSLLLHMPEMAQRLEALRTYIRDEASLPQRLQELVMISVAGGKSSGRPLSRSHRASSLSVSRSAG